MTQSRLSNFITTRLGHMKAWAACNSLDWVTCYHLHFTHCISCITTCQVVYIHVHYGIHGEMYIGIDSRLIDLSLYCIICSQIKKDEGFGCQTRTTDILSPERAAVHRVVPTPPPPPGPPRQHPVAWESPKFVGSGGLCKICAVWTVFIVS